MNIKETIEEVAEGFALDKSNEQINKYYNSLESFKKGAKWQQERSYSEEDMLKAAQYGYNFHKTTQFPEQEFEDSCIRNTQQWFEQFKKK